MTEITKQDILSSQGQYEAHYNLGPDGYGYGFRVIAYPRVSFIDYHYKRNKTRPHGSDERKWYVDGAPVESIDEAVSAVNKPVALTDEENAALACIPDEFAELHDVREAIAGEKHGGGAIMPNTPHSRALRVLDALKAKGMIEYGKLWPAGYKPGSVTEHMRWSPTVRRRTHGATSAGQRAQ